MNSHILSADYKRTKEVAQAFPNSINNSHNPEMFKSLQDAQK